MQLLKVKNCRFWLGWDGKGQDNTRLGFGFQVSLEKFNGSQRSFLKSDLSKIVCVCVCEREIETVIDREKEEGKNKIFFEAKSGNC